METILNEIECRILGALVEKELATPDYYPLTLNSLTAACNQKRKEQRYAHLFSGEPTVAEEEALASPGPARLRVMAENERLSVLEEEVRLLREEVAELRKALEEFRAQFE